MSVLNESIRAFIAVELPEDVLTTLGRIQDHFKKYRLNFRWVRPENIHLTLKFLGNVQTKDIQKVERVLSELTPAHAVFELRGAGIGVFPNLKNPRVLWAGVGGAAESLRSLQKTIEDRLEDQGFARENRPFKGHLTLGRAKGGCDTRRVMEAMAACEAFAAPAFTVRRLTFFKSDLQKGGPVYTRLAIAPLAETPPDSLS